MKITRRTFLRATGAMGALTVSGAALGGCQAQSEISPDTAFPAPTQGKPLEAKVDPKTGDVEINPDVLIRYSTCVGCACACGNRIKLDRATGAVLGVGGNPYNPACAWPILPTSAPLEDAYRSMSFTNGGGNDSRGTVCGRGNGTLDAVTQPDRITTPLKRSGKRGEGKWTPISWEQLITEVTEGGKLFSDIGEDIEIEGLKSLHDNKTLIDPEKPLLGPKSNQLLIWNARSDGRGFFNGRFASTFGTTNFVSHGTS